jgi:3-oxoacyl-[acyl-carrier protein] reductase
VNDKVVIVTGANGDIGKPLVGELLDRGYQVVACVRDKASTSLVDSERLKVYDCNFSNSGSIKSCTNEIKKDNKSIYGLVNCIGIAHGSGFMMTKPEDIQQVFDINYFSVLDFTQQVINKMIKKRSGSIVNLASTAGILSDKGTLAYGGSKAALIHSSRVMATELGSFGIRVNVVAPAVVESKMSSLMDKNSIDVLNERASLSNNIYPQEVVDMIIYLLGKSSINITGQTFRIDRGITS